jgi:hypothetical protein
MWNTEESRKIHRKAWKNNLKAMGSVDNRIILNLILKNCDEGLRLDLPDTKIQTMTGSFDSMVVEFEVPSNAGNLYMCLLIVRGNLLCVLI